ncbi:MAG TPA: hypothetical protein PLC98_11340 [Anaerolineales bacterium]|nr:hypothetical protein [Anaerolineales bacterium]
MTRSITVCKFRNSIATLPADRPQVRPGIWYKTQKEHWLGWLAEYHTPGAYNRKSATKRDARFAYNHVVNHHMLLWLISACGVDRKLAKAAQQATEGVPTMMQKSGAVRRLVPWHTIEQRLWPAESE